MGGEGDFVSISDGGQRRHPRASPIEIHFVGMAIMTFRRITVTN